MNFFSQYIQELNKFISNVDASILESSAVLLRQTQQRNRKVIIIGNGGSAAIASHVSVDLVKTAGLRAINFN